MNYKELLIPIGEYGKIDKARRRGVILDSVSFIVAHDTGNPNSTALQNVKYFVNTAYVESASAHLFVDDIESIMCIPCFKDTERAHHVLYNLTSDNMLFGDDANDAAIGIELCYFPNDYDRSLKAYKNYVKAIVDLMVFHNINEGAIVSHASLDRARKTDPYNAFNVIGKSWEDFLEDIKKELFIMTADEIMSECFDQPEKWIEQLDRLEEFGNTFESEYLCKYIRTAFEKVWNTAKDK